MCKFAICDDEPADVVYLRSMIESWAKERGKIPVIREFPSAESFLFAYEEEKDFDILLLDIEMGAMSGVELAKKLRGRDRSVQIIFITGYMEYISEGYDVEALHYLLKPVAREKFLSVLDRAARRVQMRERALILETSGEMLRIPFYEIEWIEVQKNYVTLHGREDYCVKRTLKGIRQELDERFFQIHRSYIVSIPGIYAIQDHEAILLNKNRIPISRKYFNTLQKKLVNWHLNG